MQCIQNQWTLTPPTHIHVTPDELMPTQLRHTYLTCPSKDHKLSALKAYLKREVKTGRFETGIVFMSRDGMVEEVVKALEEWAETSLPPLDHHRDEVRRKGKQRSPTPASLC